MGLLVRNSSLVILFSLIGQRGSFLKELSLTWPKFIYRSPKGTFKLIYFSKMGTQKAYLVKNKGSKYEHKPNQIRCHLQSHPSTVPINNCMDDFNCLNVSNASKEFQCSLKPCSEDTKHLDEPKLCSLRAGSKFLISHAEHLNQKHSQRHNWKFLIFNPDVYVFLSTWLKSLETTPCETRGLNHILSCKSQ